MPKNNQHIVTHGNNWAVRGENHKRVTSIFETQKEAINAGRQIAINNNSELFIHGKNGQIRDRDSYGNDSCPPKDTRF